MTLQKAIETLKTLQARLAAENSGAQAELNALEMAVEALKQWRAIDRREGK